MQLVKEGDKVGASEATLLNMLNISPFTYGLVVQQVYDQGTVFSPRVLDITDEDLMKSFQDVSIVIIISFDLSICLSGQRSQHMG